MQDFLSGKASKFHVFSGHSNLTEISSTGFFFFTFSIFIGKIIDLCFLQ